MMILTAMYTANLTANLTTESSGVSVTSFQDLLSQDYYSWGTGAAYDFVVSQIENGNDEVLKDISKSAESIYSWDEVVKKVKGERFIFIDTKSAIGYTFRDDCKKIIADTSKFNIQFALGMPLNTPYLEMINKRFISYREEGFFNIGFEKWYGNGDLDCEASTPNVGSNTKFSLRVLIGLFLILLFGVLWALCTSCAEFFVVSYSDSIESDTTFFQCLRTRISLKKREVCEEWFGGNDNQAASPKTSTQSSSRSSRLLNRPLTERGNFILRQQSKETSC